MSSTLRISRSILAALITLCVLFSCLPFSRTVRADAIGGKYYVYAKSETDVVLVRDGETAPEGYTQKVAVAFDGVTGNKNFELSSDDRQLEIIANNANITANCSIFDVNFYDSKLFHSAIVFDEIMVYNSEHGYDHDGEITLEGFAAWNEQYGDYAKNKDNCEYSVLPGKTLTISDAHAITAKKFTVGTNGKVTIADNPNHEPNGLNIIEKLTAPAGSITGSGNAILEIREGAKVDGGIKLFASDGSTELDYSSNGIDSTKTFHFEDSKWIMDGNQDPGNDDPPGVYVRFRDQLFTSCTYKVGNGASKDVPKDGTIPYSEISEADSITFTFVPVTGTTIANQGPNPLDVTNNSFTLTKQIYNWTTGTCYLDVGVERASGIYFHYDDNLVKKVVYSTSDTGPVDNVVSDKFIANSVYSSVSAIYIDVETQNANDKYWVEIQTDNPGYGTRPSQRPFIISHKDANSGWENTYDVYIREGDAPIENGPGVYLGFRSELFSSYKYKIDNGELQDIPNDGNLHPDENATSITFTFVPETGTLSVDHEGTQLSISDNSFTINKTDYDWTKDPIYFVVDVSRPNGIYFHCEDNLVDSIVFASNEGNSGSSVQNGFIPASAYVNDSSVMINVSTKDPTEDYWVEITTNNPENSIRTTEETFTISKSGDSWETTYDVSIRRGNPPHPYSGPGMNFNYSKRNSPIDSIQYSIDNGTTCTPVTDDFLSKTVFENANTVKFQFAPKEGVQLDVRVDWDQDDVGSTVQLEGYTFENNILTLTKPDNGWGAMYDIGVNSVNQPQPAGIFFVDLPEAPQNTDGVAFNYDGGDEWSYPSQSNNGLGFEADRSKTALYLKITPKQNSTGITIDVGVVSQEGEEPVSMQDFSFDNNILILSKPTGENADWAYKYVITITENSNTPTPGPTNDLLSNVEGHGFAYYTDKATFSEKAADLKNCLATEIYCTYTLSNTSDYSSFADLLNNLTVVSTHVFAADDAVGLPYISFTLTRGEATTQPFKVYILDSATKFIVKTCVDDKGTPETNDDEYLYDVVDPGSNPDGSANSLTLRMNYLGVPGVFGNGVCIIDTNNGLHITQDNSNIDLHYATTPGGEAFPANNIGKINTNLIIEKYEVKTLNAVIAGTKLQVSGTTSCANTGDSVYVEVFKNSEKIGSTILTAGSDQSHSFSGEISIAGHGITNPSQITVRASDREGGVVFNGSTVGLQYAVVGYSLKLDSCLGVTYWITFGDEFKGDVASIDFAYDSSLDELKSQSVAFDPNASTSDYEGYPCYQFGCKVAIAEFTQPITANIKLANGSSISLDRMSARQILKQYSSEKYNNQPKLQNLAAKILNYGYYSMVYFRKDLTPYAEDAIAADQLTSPDVYDPIRIATPDGITYNGSSVIFMSGNRIRHYFNAEAADQNFTVGGKSCTPVAAGTQCYVYTDEIFVLSLSTKITVSVNGTESSYSVLDYINIVVSSDKAPADMKNLAKALYMYYDAAMQY